MRYLVLIFSAVIALVAVVRGGLEKKRIKPVVVWTGIDSKQGKETSLLCGDQGEWQAAWTKHHGGNEGTERRICPEVDFESYMVVVIFHGKSFQNDGIVVKAVIEETHCIRVRYEPGWYQIAIVDGPKIDRSTKSYAFVVLPKTNKRVVLEEDVQHVINDPSVWKERASLSLPAKKQ